MQLGGNAWLIAPIAIFDGQRLQSLAGRGAAGFRLGTLPTSPPTMSKSIWRGPNAQHFELVHRSQRDPLANDPDADQRVLAPRQRTNEARRMKGSGLTRAQLEQAGAAQGQRSNIGEAARYGVYYDDTDYDYMQHLKTVGQAGEPAEDDEPVGPTFLLEAPKKDKAPKQASLATGIEFKDSPPAAPSESSASKKGLHLPPEALPSAVELPYRHAPGAKEGEVRGLQPGLNAHLRQTLEALEDEEFVEDNLEDDFFDDIVIAGAQDGGAEPDWMEKAPEGDEKLWMDTADLLKAKTDQGEQIDEEQLSLAERVALFKAGNLPGMRPAGGEDDEGEEDEAADEVGSLPGLESGRRRAPRAASSTGSTSIFGEEKKKKKAGVKARLAASQAGKSAFSMSSSAMSRNKGLSEVDTRFDAILRQYGRLHTDDDDAAAFGTGFDEEEDQQLAMEAEARAEEEEAEEEGEAEREMTEAEKQSLERAMSDFMNHFDVYGGKLAPKLGDQKTSAVDKIGMIRESLGEARMPDLATWAAEQEEYEKNPDAGMPEVRIIGSNREKWDVETILSTRTNLENHPRTISAASVSVAPSSAYAPTTLGSQRISARGMLGADVEPKIRIDPRTGLSKVVGYRKRRTGPASSVSASSDPSEAAPESSVDAAVAENDDKEEGGESGTESDDTVGPCTVGTIKRPKGESSEDKKARKQMAKQEKALRRQQKTATKQAFKSEAKRQTGLRNAAAAKAGDVSSAERAGALRL